MPLGADGHLPAEQLIAAVRNGGPVDPSSAFGSGARFKALEQSLAKRKGSRTQAPSRPASAARSTARRRWPIWRRRAARGRPTLPGARAMPKIGKGGKLTVLPSYPPPKKKPAKPKK